MTADTAGARKASQAVGRPGRRLTSGVMSGNMSDMRQVNAREFQKAFSKVADELHQGETVAVTKRGKPLGFFTKAPLQSVLTMPDFDANLASVPLVGSVGEEIMAEVIDERLF